MPIYAFEGRRPLIDSLAWVAPSAYLIGDVRIGPRAYIGWGAILRADHGTIIVEEGSAVEEGVIVHTSSGFVSRIGRQVTLGHGAMLHDATIKDYAVVGIRATLSNRSVVGRWAIVGEAALLREDQEVPDESIAVGAPVKIIGTIQERHKERWLDGKRRYQEFTQRNQKGLKRIE